MADTLSNAQIQEYTDIVRHLAQQGDARLRPHVYETPSGGEKYNFERLGESTAIDKTTRKTATPDAEPPWTNRTAVPLVKQWAAYIEHAEKAQMIVDPQSAYAQNGAMAMRRAIDDELIAAATRDAGDKAGGTNAFPAGQVVGAGVGQACNLALITQVNEKFQLNDVDPDEPKVFVVSPIEVRQMLNEATLTSADYMSVKALSANGMVQNFLGFTWILSNRLDVTTGARTCLAFTKRGIGLTVNYDIMVRVAERADLSHIIQVYMEWVMGAVRVEDEHVVSVQTSETFV
jgi:hypothetical protein